MENYLRTPENISLFLDSKMKYTSDINRRGVKEDNWQLAYAIIKRQEGGRMFGDCDDYAFLAKELLSRIHNPKPISAHVMGITGYAICVWIEKNKYGQYYACTIGIFGFDKNGNRQIYKNGRINKTKNKINSKGSKTMQDALNSVLKKYDKPGKGIEKPQRYRVSNGRVKFLENTTNILGEDNGANGKNGRTEYRNMPVGLLISNKNSREYKNTVKATRGGRGDKYPEKQRGTIIVSNMPTKTEAEKWERERQ